MQRIVQSVHQKSSPKSAENIQKQNTIEKLLKKVKDQKKESDRNVVELDVRDARLKSLEDELCKVREQNDKLKIKGMQKALFPSPPFSLCLSLLSYYSYNF